jgi:protein SCO1/2
MHWKNKLKAGGMLGFVLLGGLVASIQYFKSSPVDTMSQFHGTYLERPRQVSTFTLEGIDNQAFNNDSLKGKWTLLFFGFTHCPSLCPTTMAELAKMYNILAYKKSSSLPRIVMISMDPMRDSTAKLSQYVRSFHKDFYAARGDIETIASLSRELGVVYERTSTGRDGLARGYTIGHSGALMLINPKGELNAFFNVPHSAPLLARDYLLLMSIS